MPPEADLLLEIGTEEIPARFLPAARAHLAAAADNLLAEERLAHKGVRSFATPRRLVLHVKAVALRQQSKEIVVLGPMKKQCFDEKGEPTPAMLGFARRYGIKPAQLLEKSTEKGPRMAYVGIEKGRPADKVLPELLERLIGGVDFPKSMRWPQSPAPFARPVRWLLALLGKRKLAIKALGLAGSSATRGRRFVHPKPFKVPATDRYWKIMRDAGIELDEKRRKLVIRERAERLVERTGGKVLWDQDLLDEVADLVEAPVPVLGKFPSAALELPRPVLVAAMQEHQRYFPVIDGQGDLMPFFVAVCNGIGTSVAIEGNERVLKARLADARFFYQEDGKRRLQDLARRLGEVVWQARAGTVRDKCSRLEDLAEYIAGITETDAAAAKRAAGLCKADLLTQMVGEFPSLQGIVGGIYAARDGEPAVVADAIADHYRPSGAADSVPQTLTGCVVALADKLDTLVGHLALGHMPSGTADPYALRRQAIGILRILWERDWKLSLSAMLKRACGGFSRQNVDISDENVVKSALNFLRGRLEGVFADQGYAHDEIQASLTGFNDISRENDVPVLAARRLMALSSLRRTNGFRETIFALSRITNIIPRDFEARDVDVPALEGMERELYDAFEAARPQVEESAARGEFEEVYRILAGLRPVIDKFFEAVLVMDQSHDVRNRRLGLLKHIERTILLFAEVRKLVIA